MTALNEFSAKLNENLQIRQIFFNLMTICRIAQNCSNGSGDLERCWKISPSLVKLRFDTAENEPPKAT